MSAGIIEVRGLCNRFGDFSVHENLDLDVRTGEIIGVVGGSGSGKSVLMRSILALNRPQAGRIRLLGKDALSHDPASRAFIERNTGVLFQNAALFSSLTVMENVMVPLKEHSTLPEDVMTGLDPISAAGFDRLILTIQKALGLTVFLITHDLDTLYTICDRVAVIADRRVLVTAPIEEVAAYDHPWIREYFHGPRGRAARTVTEMT